MKNSVHIVEDVEAIERWKEILKLNKHGNQRFKS